MITKVGKEVIAGVSGSTLNDLLDILYGRVPKMLGKKPFIFGDMPEAFFNARNVAIGYPKVSVAKGLWGATGDTQKHIWNSHIKDGVNNPHYVPRDTMRRVIKRLTEAVDDGSVSTGFDYGLINENGMIARDQMIWAPDTIPGRVAFGIIRPQKGKNWLRLHTVFDSDEQSVLQKLKKKPNPNGTFFTPK